MLDTEATKVYGTLVKEEPQEKEASGEEKKEITEAEQIEDTVYYREKEDYNFLLYAIFRFLQNGGYRFERDIPMMILMVGGIIMTFLVPGQTGRIFIGIGLFLMIGKYLLMLLSWFIKYRGSKLYWGKRNEVILTASYGAIITQRKSRKVFYDYVTAVYESTKYVFIRFTQNVVLVLKKEKISDDLLAAIKQF